MTRRTERIASQLQEEVSRILRQEITDPRVGFVTITRVDVAPDLSHAVVYYSVMQADPDDAAAIEAVDDGLHSAAAFVRRQAARVLSLRRMPELRFRYDPSLALGTRTLELLRELEGAAAAQAAAETDRSGGDDEEA
ncbi:MAG: 30S ribosome-binding factor RbfA [Myxococcales bacterium]|nr:30S ribosome-binding factor RbfA [Myxococcales bacterium]MDH5306086.1 30S ribosome-binding factor RbfA [Myxococcales bacterium]MDH5566071.1 30S ribosome-binding factor RbfA [Myxococcales bacterium]